MIFIGQIDFLIQQGGTIFGAPSAQGWDNIFSRKKKANDIGERFHGSRKGHWISNNKRISLMRFSRMNNLRRPL